MCSLGLQSTTNVLAIRYGLSAGRSSPRLHTSGPAGTAGALGGMRRGGPPKAAGSKVAGSTVARQEPGAGPRSILASAPRAGVGSRAVLTDGFARRREAPDQQTSSTCGVDTTVFWACRGFAGAAFLGYSPGRHRQRNSLSTRQARSLQSGNDRIHGGHGHSVSTPRRPRRPFANAQPGPAPRRAGVNEGSGGV